MLFNAPMVRALLAGSKTQTRRIVKPQPFREDYMAEEGVRRQFATLAPYGRAGDRLWVRETLGHHADKGHYYAATGMHVGPLLDYELEQSPSAGIPARTIPSIHMPRWASRILLEIVSVRVERLNACSDADAIAEGIGLNPSAIGMKLTNPPGESMAIAMYRALWDSINGAGSWAINPWVWVVEFKRVTP
jgi:hypothetical protein